MQLSETIKLYPTEYQKQLISETMNTYISVVNGLVSDAVSGNSLAKTTTGDLDVNLPSALANQCIRDARSIVSKHYRECHKTVLKNRKRIKPVLANSLPKLRKPCCYINNQNYKIVGKCISFPVMINGKSRRISVNTKMTDVQHDRLINSKLGTMRIVCKSRHMVAQIVYDVPNTVFKDEGNVMGVDLGILCPAVSYVFNGKVKFYGNGRYNKYMRRHYAYLRKRLQRAKKMKAVERIDNKEQRIMRDIDHKLSHDIVATAVANDVNVIKLEQLSGIRSTTRNSRKNIPSLHNWSFYRLAMFIEYKANLAGIKVMYVNPAYTSQECPVCGHINHAKGRLYRCKCGYHTHRDILGAYNICNTTKYVGDRHTA